MIAFKKLEKNVIVFSYCLVTGKWLMVLKNSVARNIVKLLITYI